MLISTILTLIHVITTVTCYPVTGSWFNTSVDPNQLEAALKQFNSIGGDTIYLQGGNFKNQSTDEIKADPLFKLCVADGAACVDKIQHLVDEKKLVIKHWITYDYNENFTDEYIKCSDTELQVLSGGWLFRSVVVTVDTDSLKDSCDYDAGDEVAIILTAFKGEDVHQRIVSYAAKANMHVYFGLPRVPFIGSDNSSQQLFKAYKRFVERVLANNRLVYPKNSTLKGYYSDVELSPADIYNKGSEFRRDNSSLTPLDALSLWRGLGQYMSKLGFDVLKTPVLDLTRASNTSLLSHVRALETMMQLTEGTFAIRDGRGDGRAAYYSKDEANQPILEVDNSLYHILKQQNSSVNEKTTYNDIYYAPIQEFYQKLNAYGSWVKVQIVIEAYDVLSGGSDDCGVISPYSSGIGLEVQRVDKSRLDKAISGIGANVSRIAAYSWDPLFTCSSKEHPSLLEEIKSKLEQPIVSGCKFHSPQNLSIVLLGYNLDGLMQTFHVDYTTWDNKQESTDLYGYYFELDYGKSHGLVQSLQYVQLFDIPNLRNLKRAGSITVQAKGALDHCTFNYTLT